jgi:hypothetical protein
MTKSPISVAIFGGTSIACMGVALARYRTAFLLTLSFWEQFLARAWESIEIEKEGEKGGGIFLRSVLVRSKNNNDNFVPFLIFLDFNPIRRFDLQRVLIYSQWYRSIFVIAQLTVRLLKRAFEVTPCFDGLA